MLGVIGNGSFDLPSKAQQAEKLDRKMNKINHVLNDNNLQSWY